jgi:hypothetical protein
MQYKLPPRYRGFSPLFLKTNSYKKQFVMKNRVISVSSSLPVGEKSNFQKHDLSTETGNYFVSNVLVHNSNFSAVLDADGRYRVAQHNYYVIGDDPSNPTTFERCGAKLKPIAELLQSKYWPGKQIRLRGELCGPGIQKNIYGFKDHKVLLFEVDVDGKPLHALDFHTLVESEKLEAVPLIFLGYINQFLGGGSMCDLADGPSKLYEGPREGVVIRPYAESGYPGLGRLILKFRGPKYLSKETD